MDWPTTAFWPITWEPEFCPIWDWWWNINHNIIFSDYFQEKLMNFFSKSPKTTIFEPFWTFFSQVWVKMIFLEKRVSVFKSYNYLTSCKKSEKINELKTDWQTCNSDFIGPSIWRGSKKGNPLEKLSFFIDF